MNVLHLCMSELKTSCSSIISGNCIICNRRLSSTIPSHELISQQARKFLQKRRKGGKSACEEKGKVCKKRGERKRKLLGMCDGQNAGGEREHSSVRLFPLCIHILGELALDHYPLYPGFTTMVICTEYRRTAIRAHMHGWL